ncbi:hypothetical protein [Bifidobacterium sp. SO1]|uniref:hypothetical protein n=1 Tax=Bifidobacterium sp. SO1 TaxID=2809029 RepID=UPI001BDC57C3|nr:hypothetical protein [Bifidobacterium sp. SO1]MBT1161708.1 hypothetical protein [Bifidobacterium sp. SO1]
MPRNNLEKHGPRPLKAAKRFERKCGRMRYETPVDANIALGGMPDGMIARKCPNCGGYHLLHAGERLESRRGRRA